MILREDDRLGAGAHAELLEDPGDVVAHGLLADEQLHADVDVRRARWRREDANLGAAERDAAVDDLIALVGGVDGILQAQARADAEYFVGAAERRFSAEQARSIGDVVLRLAALTSGARELR
jgi:hypothetical protein